MSEKKRAAPGTKGTGNFYRITIRPKSEFVSFRNHDIGRAGHIERIAGKRADGAWDTQCWLVDKKDAKIEGGYLIGNNDDVKNLFLKFENSPKHIREDLFSAKDKKNHEEAKIKEEKYKQKKKNLKYEDEDPLIIQ